MLKKLFAYDFRWMLGKIIFAWIAVLGISIVCLINDIIANALSQQIFKSVFLTSLFAASSASVNFLFIVAIALSFTFCLIMAYIRFYRNLYSAEAYFTLCTPIEQREHVLCKFAVTIVCLVLTMAVCIVAVLVRFINNFEVVINALSSFLNVLKEPLGWLYLIEIILLGISVVVFIVFEGFLAISFGQCLKNKIVGAILFYFIINSIIETAGSMLAGAFLGLCYMIPLPMESMSHVILWLAILGSVGLSIAACSITSNRLKHNINLE